MAQYTVIFSPLSKTVKVEAGCSLLEAAGKAGIVLNSVCGGDGICGRCKMILKGGKVSGEATLLLSPDEVRRGLVLACQSFVQSDLLVEIPEETRAADRALVDRAAHRFSADQPGVPRREFPKHPLVTKIHLQLDKPTLEGNQADDERVRSAIRKVTGISSMQTGLKILNQLPDVLRGSDFSITATIGRRRDVAEIMDVRGGDTSARNYMVVVDVGTTTIVAHLVNAVNEETVGTEACFNSQSVYGREVTARIMAAEKKGVSELQRLLVEDINRLIAGLAAEHGVNLKDITAAVCSGNTTMMHFLLGLPVANIRRTPFIAACVEAPPFRAAEVGVKIHPRALLYIVPGIGSWVGGDLTAGVLATGLHESDDIAMLIDVGTNGEIIVGNQDWMMACSASTGPALEGASVECGMMAGRGAIEKVSLVNGEMRLGIIEDAEPEGLCGSGIIDLIAVLLEKGIVDRAGKFVEGSDPSLAKEEGRTVFFLCRKGDGRARKDVFITQEDIDNVITAKAAVFAATKVLLDRLSLGFDDITMLYLAGGFGSYIDRGNAIKIGLLPALPLSRIRYVGNTSLWGAKLAGLSWEAYHALRDIAGKTTYYDLMGSQDYVEQFELAMFLPHTHIELFERVNG